jgi:molybdopterin-guanine dinucleotide biosynthesis protein A
VNFAVVLLAGGEGRRIGGDKPQRPLAGETLIDRATATARLWSDDVCLAIRNGQAEVRGTRTLHDDPAIEGPLAGIASALAYARQASLDAVLTIGCDTPFLPVDLPERLEAAIGGRAAALAGSGDRLHPVCGLWRTSAIDALPGYLASGRRSIRGFAEHVGHVAVSWPADPIDPFFNINDQADLARAEAWLRSR